VPHGVLVAPELYPDPEQAYALLATQCAELLTFHVDVQREDVVVDRTAVGAGYAIPTQDALAAIRLLASMEAILCDPIYSGKALAALLAEARHGEIREPVVFWHTGGFHALFEPTYGDLLWR
jgi:1-aminocyclopropane-1-carboxylate deaminase/D-cysteine desulfhydrase-like pyridoxal-dependent ACC family enzyme